jgi:hypothetical protein
VRQRPEKEIKMIRSNFFILFYFSNENSVKYINSSRLPISLMSSSKKIEAGYKG